MNLQVKVKMKGTTILLLFDQRVEIDDGYVVVWVMIGMPLLVGVTFLI